MAEDSFLQYVHNILQAGIQGLEFGIFGTIQWDARN
jgi:hypothetical protein